MTLQADAMAAVASVDDPEFPGVSIADLGLVHEVRAQNGDVAVELIPTFLGCPALDLIRGDVTAAVVAVPGVESVSVDFVSQPSWSPNRITERGRSLLAEFTVAVRGDLTLTCPVCGSNQVEERSAFGPTACRAIAYCASCRNPVEVIRQ